MALYKRHAMAQYERAEAAEAEVRHARAALERAEEGLHETARKFTLADEERRRLTEGVREIHRTAPDMPTRLKARALLADSPDGAKPEGGEA